MMKNKRLQVSVVVFLLTFALGFSANLLNVAYGKENPLGSGTLLISNNILKVAIEDESEMDGIGTFTIGTDAGHPNPGQDFPADTDVTIFLIPDGEEALPANAVASATTTTNGIGDFPVTLVWSQPLTLGEYDIWVDVNQNGVFDGDDVWNSQSIGIYGLDVIPELPTWTFVLLVFAILTVAIAIYKRRLLKTPTH